MKSSFRQKFNYITRTTANISHFLQPIEHVIWKKFITSLVKDRTWNNEKRQLLSLPVKLSGMDITNITSISNIEYQTSNKTMKNFVNKIRNKKDRSDANLENKDDQQETSKSPNEFYDGGE